MRHKGSALFREFRWMMRDIIKNGLLASSLVPTPLRFRLLRLAGVKGTGAGVSADVFIGSGALTLGDGVFINRDCFLDTSGGIQIGQNSRIAPRVTMITATHPIGASEATRTRRTPEDNTVAEIIIGDNVWVGTSSTILPGVTIGNGCVIAAGSVVTRNCEPNGLYAGVPARRVKELPL